jgi:hypothetical protein
VVKRGAGLEVQDFGYVVHLSSPGVSMG